MGKRLGAFIALSLAYGIGNAATWYTFTDASTNTIDAYFDAGTASRTGDVVTVWIQTVYNQDSVKPKPFYSYLTKELYNCATRSHQMLNTTAYDSKGELLFRSPQTDPPEEVTPGTFGERIFEAVCVSGFPKLSDEAPYRITAYNDPVAETKLFAKVAADKKAEAAQKRKR